MGTEGAVRRTGASRGLGRGHWAAPTRAPSILSAPTPTTRPRAYPGARLQPAPLVPGFLSYRSPGQCLPLQAPALLVVEGGVLADPSASAYSFNFCLLLKGPNAPGLGAWGPHLNLQQEGPSPCPTPHPTLPAPGGRSGHNKDEGPQLALKNSPRTELETLHRS